MKENCPGFIHSRTGHCGSCQCFTCTLCNMFLGKDEHEHHECKEEDVLQWREIKATTKPCPGCQTRIFKISGCAQMWCSQCHTAFHWNTGRIERGAIHNPHYYEWMFSGGQQQRQQHTRGPNLECEHEQNQTLPALIQLQRALDVNERHFPKDENSASMTRMISQYHRIVSHYKNVVLARHRHGGENQPLLRRRHFLRNMDLRLRFLRNKLDQDQFRVRLQRSEKSFTKHLEWVRILETFVIIMTDMFSRFVRHPTQIDKQTLLDQIHHTIKITNEGIDEINRCYKSRLSKILVSKLEDSAMEHGIR